MVELQKIWIWFWCIWQFCLSSSNCSSMHSKKDAVQFGHEIRIQHRLDIPKWLYWEHTVIDNLICIIDYHIIKWYMTMQLYTAFWNILNVQTPLLCSQGKIIFNSCSAADKWSLLKWAKMKRWLVCKLVSVKQIFALESLTFYSFKIFTWSNPQQWQIFLADFLDNENVNRQREVISVFCHKS